MVNGHTITQVLEPGNDSQAENDALVSLIAEFDSAADSRKIDYLKHRYAGFNRKESGTLAGVKISTVNKWLKEDGRITHYDGLVSSGQRRNLRRDVLQEEWFRNFHLVMERDAYILKKVHGLLEETILDIDIAGKRTYRTGSPMMMKSDWDYYAQMRKMYTPDAWQSIEKAMSGQGDTFNINELILNMAKNQQVNINS